MTGPGAGPAGPEIGLHLFLPPGPLEGALARLAASARLALASGFDRVSVGEHHGDVRGYLPTSWALLASLLATDPTARVGAYPILVGLREPAMAIEEIDVAAALFPGRLDVALGMGYADHDFAFCNVTRAEARRRFRRTLELLSERCRPGQVPPWLIAGGGPRTVEMAAAHGLGLLLPPLGDEEERAVIVRYEDLGGRGRVVLQRWIGFGEVHTAIYGTLGSPWRPADRTVHDPSPEEVADLLGSAAALHPRVAAVSLRVGGPELDPDRLPEAIERSAAAVARLRKPPL